ncbi:Exportin-6 [Papilio machaon]|uniref:Exportin-6 n=1 Tax=Papilio machaon TaxID=76193 RepID=A0A194QT65_PAPMA|nr:Exportin-6 [Papilio machaon]
MDKYLRPERFDIDPSDSSGTRAWIHWRKTFESFISVQKPTAPETDAQSDNFGVDEALASLEMLMCEFFAPSTNNFRKREIESMLENFSNGRGSWKHCLLFLQKSQNQYVQMFILTTLENIINKLWISLSDNERTEIRLTLWNELMAKHEVMLYFIRNKLASLMIAIARYDWPHEYPDFFTNIVELLRSDGHRCLLGLILAQTASEELGAARDTGVMLPSTRRTQLERLMLKGMPQMLSALSDILEKNAQKEGQSNPPPSPTSGFPQTSALPDLLANAHDVCASDKALNMEIVVKCLTTLQHLFSWLPLSSHVPASLVTTVFYWGSIATQTQSGEAALAGLGGVCELLYRRYAPPSSAATALRLHHCSLRLLRHLTHASHHSLYQAHHDYLNKLAEFLKLFVSLHFKRLEAEPEFDAIEFLSYLFQYTFQVPTCTIFVNCLDIWIQFIDILKPEDTAKYWEALQALVNGVLNKIQFQHNKAQLQHLDNDICDDDGETEWQTFLKHCIECIARVADLAPLEVFTSVLERWQSLAGVYARAAGRGGVGGAGCAPGAAAAGAEPERLLAALLDLATLTRLLGRLAPALLAEAEGGRGATAGAALLERAAAALAGAALTRPHRAHSHTHAHAHAFVQVHAEMFACMGAWCCYATECNVPIQTMEGLFNSAVPFLIPHEMAEPPLLCHAAAHLLLSLSKNVKFSNDPILLVGDLYNHAQRSLHYLEPKEPPLLCHAAAHLLLSLSKNVKFSNDPILLVGDLYNHAQRSLHYLEPKVIYFVFNVLLCLAISIPSCESWVRIHPRRNSGLVARGAAVAVSVWGRGRVCGWWGRGAGAGGEAARALLAAWAGALPHAGPAAALPPLTDLLHAFAAAPTQPKKILAEGIQGAAETALRMLCEPAYAAAETEITDFFLALFTALLQQLGNFAYTAIDVFLEVAQKGESEASLERLVECVRLGVEAGGGGVRVRAVLELLHHHVLPRAQPHAPGLARAAHRLLASVLLYRWRYFFPHKCEEEEGARRTSELRGALAALGRALLSDDIDLLRTALTALDLLNTKWKLYHKASDIPVGVPGRVLVGVVTGRGRGMRRAGPGAGGGGVDFAAFRHAFLPAFLRSLPGLAPHHAALLNNFPSDTDLPSFTASCHHQAYQSLAENNNMLA